LREALEEYREGELGEPFQMPEAPAELVRDMLERLGLQ
jgi:hypothetical protein